MIIQKHAIPGWGIDEAEDEKRRLERQEESTRLNAIPEYVRRKKDLRDMCDLLADLLYVDNHEFAPPPHPQHPHRITATYRMGKGESKSLKPPQYDADNCDTQEFKNFQQQRAIFRSRLHSYVRTFGINPWDSRRRVPDQREAPALLGQHIVDIVSQGLRRAPDAYDVGSSLYLYQQMHDRKIEIHPSLSKAAWLVKNAPMRMPSSDKHTPRGKWGRIQEHWKDHFDDSHYWAAIVTMTKSPLQFNEEQLLNLVCEPDLDRLYRLANTFLQFRQRVTPPRTSVKRPAYLKQCLPDMEIRREDRVDPLEIPNLLQDFQWNALSRYSPK